jgi:hypothetical protein
VNEADSGVAGFKDLGVRRGDYRRVHPGPGCPVVLRFGVPPTTPGARGSDAVEPRGTGNVITAFSGQRRGDPGSMRKGGDGAVRGTPWGGKRPPRAQPDGF